MQSGGRRNTEKDIRHLWFQIWLEANANRQTHNLSSSLGIAHFKNGGGGQMHSSFVSFLGIAHFKNGGGGQMHVRVNQMQLPNEHLRGGISQTHWSSAAANNSANLPHSRQGNAAWFANTSVIDSCKISIHFWILFRRDYESLKAHKPVCLSVCPSVRLK